MTRIKRLKLNTITSLILQITMIICGFITPRLILEQYGSVVNGLVNSISQFLCIISFMDLGVGAVVESSLYEPLAKKDASQINMVIASATRFFKRISMIMLIYIVVLVTIYPYIASEKFGFTYTAILIIAIGINIFGQYYFGMVNKLLLSADQSVYIYNTIQLFTLIFNTAVSALLIKCGYSIQMVKIISSVIYLLRPLLLHAYVKRHYNINRKISYVGEPISQKWNGMAQHIAAIILDNTDTIVLTVFSTLSNVSVYSVYHLVVYGVKALLLSMTSGVQALIGEMWAKRDMDKVSSFFYKYEWTVHTCTIFIFGCTAILIMPFVGLYTKGVTDAEYIQPMFAFLITTANAVHCLRLPYNVMIKAAGHYRQTQSNYVWAAVINVVVSVLAVKSWGLVGVAIGTLVAMIYQTVWMAIYCSRQLLKRDIKIFIKQFLTDALIVLLAGYITYGMIETVESYFLWVLLALKISIIWGIISIGVNLLFYRDKLVSLIKKGV